MKSDVLCDGYETQVFLNFTERLLTAGEWKIIFKDNNQFIIKEEHESIKPSHNRDIFYAFSQTTFTELGSFEDILWQRTDGMHRRLSPHGSNWTTDEDKETMTDNKPCSAYRRRGMYKRSDARLMQQIYKQVGMGNRHKHDSTGTNNKLFRVLF